MPRPPKYSDTDISNAIQSLVAKGEAVNPTRVRAVLGGGSATRIRAVLEKYAADTETGATASGMPNALRRLAQGESAKAVEQVISLVHRCWSIARDEAAATVQADSSSRDEQVSLLTTDLAAADDRCLRAEQERDRLATELEVIATKRDVLERERDSLAEALRNAESDLRAMRMAIGHFENSQRRDRDEVRTLQRRVEGLLVELTALRASATTGEPSN